MSAGFRSMLFVTAVVLAQGASVAAQEGGNALGDPSGSRQVRPASARSAHAEDRSTQDLGVESRIRLRPVDRATVRIIAVGGADSTAIESRRTNVHRVVAVPRAAHGSGVVVDRSGVVLTAAHVAWGSDAIAVLRPGSDEPMPAKVVYVDPDHDVAFLKVRGPTPHHLPLPKRAGTLQVSQRVSASGYPLDVQQRYPAAVSGEVSREANDGSLQVALSVNPGNSGGPVVDDDGRLIGILSRRGEPRAGVAGIAFLEPLRFILPAHRKTRRVLQGRPPTFQSVDDHVAKVVAGFVHSTDDDRPIYEQTALATVKRAASAAPTPEAAMIVASHAWNMHIALLEARRERDASRLAPEDRRRAEQLMRTAVDLSGETMRKAPYLRRVYPVGRSIVNSKGRPFVPSEK
ncbi:MAG: S1C family serine protease [Myxococcota bacterium]